MKYLFTTSGLRNVEAFCFSKCLFAFDYDGTLAKIVSNPSEAVMAGVTGRRLKRLIECAPVAVISGRSLSDLGKLMAVQPRFRIGNHGLEGLPKKQFSGELAIRACQNWKKYLVRTLRREAGIEVEDKQYSLALHYRKARLKKEAKAEILECVARLQSPPRVILGKCVVNLVPAGAPHKGIALMELMLELGLSSAIYVGDDDTDEDVFALPESRILTIRVGRKETSRARFFLKRQTEINRLLRTLLQVVERAHG